MTAATKTIGIGAPLRALTLPDVANTSWDELWIPSPDKVFTDTGGTTQAFSGDSVKNCTLDAASAGSDDMTEATNPPTFQLTNAEFGGRPTLDFTTSQTMSVENTRASSQSGSVFVAFSCATDTGTVFLTNSLERCSITRQDGVGWQYKHGWISTTNQGTADGNVHVASVQFSNVYDEWSYMIDGTFYSGDGVDGTGAVTDLILGNATSSLKIAAVGWSAAQWGETVMQNLDTAAAFDFNLS